MTHAAAEMLDENIFDTAVYILGFEGSAVTLVRSLCRLCLCDWLCDGAALLGKGKFAGNCQECGTRLLVSK